MAEHILPWTSLLNWLIGKPIAALLDLLGLPYPQEMPIANHLVVTGILVAGLLWFASWLRNRLEEVPNHWSQHLV